MLIEDNNNISLCLSGDYVGFFDFVAATFYKVQQINGLGVDKKFSKQLGSLKSQISLQKTNIPIIQKSIKKVITKWRKILWESILKSEKKYKPK